ncbi:hypothetical protein CHUAL_012486 [Chamberlinius hualienensis]
MAPVRGAALKSKRVRKQELQKWFVSKVREYRLLYDPNDPNYKDIPVKEKTWSRIGQLCGLSGSASYLKWKSLRDRYIRERKLCLDKQDGDYNNLYKSKWPLYEDVASIIESISSQYSIQPTNLSSVKKPPVERKCKKEAPTEDEVNHCDESWSSKSEENSSVEPCFPVVVSQSSHSCSTTTSKAEIVPNQNMDQVEYYLASLIPRLRQLPPLELSRLRLQFEQYVFDAEMRVMDKNS